MLAEFKVRNYKNFKDELQFSLKSAKSYEFHQEVLCNGIIKDAVVIGYNASGKTNLGLAMMDITTHLTDKYERRDGASIFYSNLYNEEDSASFVYQFIFDSSVLEYAYEKENAYQVRRECIRIDGKEVLKNEKGHCFVDLRGAETLNLANWDDAISFVKYVYANTVLDREDKDCQVFIKFMRFVNQMLWFSSTEGLRAVGANSVRGNMLEEICHMENGVKHLEDFLNFLDQCAKEYQYAFENMSTEDKRLQDLLHELEFAADKAERNRVDTSLQRSRRERRKSKDMVKLYERIVKFSEDQSNRRTINLLRQLLGQQRKEEEYLRSNRTYKKRMDG